MSRLDAAAFCTPLPNGITINHLELHNQSIRESRPIVEFEYLDVDGDIVVLTVCGSERVGLLADLTDFLESTSLSVRQANIYTLPNDAIMDQFTLEDPRHILKEDDTVRRMHDALVTIFNSPRTGRSRHREHNHTRPLPPAADPRAVRSLAKDSLYDYELLGHRVPISLLAPRVAPRTGITRRFSSNLALTELEEEHRLERETVRQKSEAVTANFVDHAISSLIDGDYLYYYSSDTRYRYRFTLLENKTHLQWGDSRAVRLSRYAGCLYGPKSAVFQDLGNRLVDPEWLCFSLVSNPPSTRNMNQPTKHPPTIDLVCISADQVNRWLLALQSLCRPTNQSLMHRLTLDDITRLRVVYKIRAHAHARGLTVRRFVLKRVREASQKRSSLNTNGSHMNEVVQLEAELARVQKTLLDYARRETLLNTSIRDFQTSWEVDLAQIEFMHPIGQGAFSEMWKGMWRSTPVAVKRLTTNGLADMQLGVRREPPKIGNDANRQLDTSKLSAEDRHLLHDFRLEVTMLSKLRHPNVVLFLGAATSLPHMYILTEFCHGGSLFAALRKRSWRTSLSLPDLRNVARHIARGVCYLHALNIIHRDLKTQNLLLDRPVEEGCPVVKVADFGLSRNFTGIGTVSGSVAGVMTSETGTYRWMAPEMIRHEPYNEKVDVYSYGVVLWELFSCEVPFAGVTPIQAAFAVADKHLRPKCESDYAKGVNIPRAWHALIERCWHRSSHERPRFQDVLHILDEMETCAEGDVPASLRQWSKFNGAPAKRSDKRPGAGYGFGSGGDFGDVGSADGDGLEGVGGSSGQGGLGGGRSVLEGRTSSVNDSGRRWDFDSVTDGSGQEGNDGTPVRSPTGLGRSGSSPSLTMRR